MDQGRYSIHFSDLGQQKWRVFVALAANLLSPSPLGASEPFAIFSKASFSIALVTTLCCTRAQTTIASCSEISMLFLHSTALGAM